MNKGLRWLGLILFAAGAAAQTASSVNAETGVTDKEIVIGSCVVLSGPERLLGETVQTGAKAYLEYVNREKGGVNGRKIRLITHDDGYEPDKAVSCFNQLMDEGVFAMAFTVGTPTAAKYVTMAEARKVPLLGMGTGADFIYQPLKRYIFNLRASYGDEAESDIDHLWDDLGMRRIAVIYQNDAFGGSVVEGVARALKKHGSFIVAQASYPRNSEDIDSALQAIQAANPDAVILGAVYNPAGDILKKSAELGFHPQFAIIPGRIESIQIAGKKAAEGAIWATLTPFTSQTDLPTVALHLKLMKKYSPGFPPIRNTLDPFDQAMVLVEGLRRAGPDLTREKFVNALESMQDFDMGLGPDFKLHFSAENHKGFNKVHHAVVRNGQEVPLNDWKQLLKK